MVNKDLTKCSRLTWLRCAGLRQTSTCLRCQLVVLLWSVAQPGPSRVGDSPTRGAKMRKKISNVSVRKNKKNLSKFEVKMRKVELLPTRDCEAGYGPDCDTGTFLWISVGLNREFAIYTLYATATWNPFKVVLPSCD